MDQIIGPTIERSTGRGPVEVYRAFAIAMIDEANNCLYASGNNERWARGSAVVSNKTSWQLARIDLRSEGLDIKLVVPHLLVSDGVDHFPTTLQYWNTRKLRHLLTA
jgi:hypothetical protein